MKWNLNDVCPDDQFDNLLKDVDDGIETMEKWWNKLNPEMSLIDFKKFLEFDEEMSDKFSRLGHLPMLKESINQKDTKARLMKTKVDNLSLKFSQRTRKISHWLKGLEVENKKRLDDINAKRLFAVIDDLEYGLNYARRAAKHTLSQREEEIIANKDVSGIGAISDLRALIEGDFVYQMGKRKIKTQGQLLAYVHSENSKNREMAYRALFEKHKEHSDKFFVGYQAVVRDWGFEAKIRGYDSPISMRNFANHLPDEVVQTLLSVCRDKKSVFQRYFSYKAKLLNPKTKSELSRFDLYAPIKFKTKRSKKYTYDESKDLVIKSFEKFSHKWAEYGQKVIDDNHIDWLPIKNKRSGAFCATVSPKITPYVMLNHTNTLRDVSTLAHELGHAIHSLYANKHYPSAQHANLPLSETASTFGEMILFEEMLNQETNNEVKKEMLWEKIGESYATILRQAYFEVFEIEAHKMIAQGTTEAELSKLWLSTLKEQYGNSMKVDPIFKYEWMYISHIFESPFYCYAYSFGELLSLSLFAQYKKEGTKFIPKIESILEAGGSRDPMKVLADAGINPTEKSFWEGGMKVVEEWQKQLEKL